MNAERPDPEEARAWRKIDRILGITDEAMRRHVHREIGTAILQYQAIRNELPKFARPNRVGLQEVYDAADALDRALAKLRDIDLQRMRSIPGGNHWRHDASGFREPVIDIRRLAGTVIDNSQDRGGRIPAVAHDNLVVRLARLYEGDPPQRKASAPGLRVLVEEVRGLAGDDPNSFGPEPAAEKAIQRALRTIRTKGQNRRKIR